MSGGLLPTDISSPVTEQYRHCGECESIPFIYMTGRSTGRTNEDLFVRSGSGNSLLPTKVRNIGLIQNLRVQHSHSGKTFLARTNEEFFVRSDRPSLDIFGKILLARN